MKGFKVNVLWVSLLMLIFSASVVFAQFEDDPFAVEEEEKEVVDCIPENLTVGWDSLENVKYDQDVRLLFNFGAEYFKNKSYDEALPYLWRVFIKDNDRYARAAVRRLAEIYFYKGMVDSTLIVCYRGLKDFPDLIRLHHYAGLLQQKLGRSVCAIPHFEKLVENDSTNINYLKTLAFLYFKEEDDRCIDIQQRVVDIEPTNAEEANNLATYVSAIKGEGADLEYREQAYKKDPENIDLAFRYADAAVRSGAYEKALEPLGVVISKDPSKRTYLLRAEAYENLNRAGNAIDDYKAILELDPKEADVMLRIAVNYRLMNNFGNAKYWINRALQAKPGYGLAYITMGEIYEAAVPYCQNQRPKNESKYEDKLVYELAYKEYEKAKGDPAFRSAASKKQDNVKPFIPNQEDRFMHKNDTIESPCYDWLK